LFSIHVNRNLAEKNP